MEYSRGENRLLRSFFLSQTCEREGSAEINLRIANCLQNFKATLKKAASVSCRAFRFVSCLVVIVFSTPDLAVRECTAVRWDQC